MGIYYVAGVPYSSDYLMHYGIKGQKWGVRRFQNPDGTRTEAGKKRYSDERALKDAYEWNTRNGEKKYFKVKGLLKEKVLDNSYNESLDIIFKNNDLKKSYDAFHNQWDHARDLWRKTYEQHGDLSWNEYSNTKAYKEYSKAIDDYWKMRYDFSGKALRKIGYSDTIKARKYLDGIIFDD